VAERVTSAFVEAFSAPTVNGRVTEAFTEVFHSPVASGRVTEAFLEVFYSPGPPIVATAPITTSSGYRLYTAKPNAYDCCLWREEQQHRKLDLKRQTCPMIEDWDGRTIPGLGLEFFASASVLTPAPGAGNVQVLTWTPGPGQHGMIYGIVFWYTGTGFVPGSGDIFWRLKVGRAWAQGLGNVSVPLGAPGAPWGIQDYIPVEQGQTAQVIVQVPNLSGNIQVGTSRILAQLLGWTYPQY
jgi:hypothetical protein